MTADCVSLSRHNRQQASHAEGVGLRAVARRSAQQGEEPPPSNCRDRRRFKPDPGPISFVCPLQVAVYVPGSKGAPSFVRLYQYPVLGGPTAALANKSFFKADRVSMQWNKRGGRPGLPLVLCVVFVFLNIDVIRATDAVSRT